ncbi:MAG TPA: PARP-type zinc finger-containing protein [Candidatus Polarisedimenticolaceae bacterium]|nr:PARP-type zinc finger-containing protein [Candidatus Polarisedimenticolaceae bacterium]
MPHTIEPAASARAACRGCGQRIAKGELRFGERMPNPFAEGEMTHWFHLACAAYKRPESLLEVLGPDAEDLERRARRTLEHRRLRRVDGAEHAPTGKALCRSCRQPIERDAWRVRLVFYEDGRFNPGGFIHLDCREAYFETRDILDRLLHFSPKLSAEDRAELERYCSKP